MLKSILLIALILQGICAYPQQRFDIIINEVMADPSPAVMLPPYEWIEVKNRSNADINLQNWRIGDLNSVSGPLPAFTLRPDSLVIICGTSALSALSLYNSAIAVSNFPSLDNDADRIYIKSPNGVTIHAIAYSLDLYQNELKKAGGWTLEMADPSKPCTIENNWKASVDPRGGTPGHNNSIISNIEDNTGPSLVGAYTIGPNSIMLVFDQGLDSIKGATITHYSADNGLSFLSAEAIAPLFDRVRLITTDMIPGTIYNITVRDVTDCLTNPIDAGVSIKSGLPVTPLPGDLVVNEILFDPPSNGYDYVELYNNSQKIFDAATLSIANKNSNGVISSIKPISSEPRYILPGDYIVVTEEADILALNYLVTNRDHVIELAALPSYPDDEGKVLLLDSQGNIIDEVHYRDDWHFALIGNPEGVSLERIDPVMASSDRSNWHSAASTAGYGTPGYKNSQLRPQQDSNMEIEVMPKVFSPDNDGLDDYITIKYKVQEPGYVGNILVFDLDGRVAKIIAGNSILGINGSFTWDGLDTRGRKLPIGPYVILFELYNLAGKKTFFKQSVVLARFLK